MIKIQRTEPGKFAILTIFFAALVLILSGCDQNGGITIPSGATRLTVSVKSVNNPMSGIIITDAKVLISKVDLEVNGSGNNEEIQSAPFVVNFNIDTTLKVMTTGYLIRDFYTKLKFQIHQTQDGETLSDPEFKDGSGANQRYSFIVKGTYNGNSFVYKSKKSADVIISFSSVQNIDMAQMNITVLFNKLSWFKNGAVDLDPSNAQNDNLIDENIKNSFSQAFVDNDKSGQPDH